MRREFLAVVHGQRVPHLRGNWSESADRGLIQGQGRLVRHYFCQKKRGFPVNKGSYRGVFAGTFNGIALPIPRTGLLLDDFRRFVEGNTADYLPAAVLYPVSFAWFRVFLPEMDCERGVLCRFSIYMPVDSPWEACFSSRLGYRTPKRPEI
jgi:hypothetical protein